MQQIKGVPPSGSGYSAEPEPSCTVSAVPVSIPNAVELNEHGERFLLATPRQQPASANWIAWRAGKGFYTGNQFASFARGKKAWFQRIPEFKQSGAWAYRLSPEGAAIASAIEARRAETPSGSVADESAVAKPDAQPTPVSDHISNKGER